MVIFLLLFTNKKSFQSISFSLKQTRKRIMAEEKAVKKFVDFLLFCSTPWCLNKKKFSRLAHTAPWPGLVPAGWWRDAENCHRAKIQ